MFCTPLIKVYDHSDIFVNKKKEKNHKKKERKKQKKLAYRLDVEEVKEHSETKPPNKAQVSLANKMVQDMR